MELRYEVSGATLGILRAHCAHCGKLGDLELRGVTTSVLGISGGEAFQVLICPGCTKLSRRLGLFSRLGQALLLLCALVPFAGAAFGLGYFAREILREGTLPPAGLLLMLLALAGLDAGGLYLLGRALVRRARGSIVPMSDTLGTGF